VVQVRVVLDAGVPISFRSACAVVNVAVVYSVLLIIVTFARCSLALLCSLFVNLALPHRNLRAAILVPEKQTNKRDEDDITEVVELRNMPIELDSISEQHTIGNKSRDVSENSHT